MARFGEFPAPWGDSVCFRPLVSRSVLAPLPAPILFFTAARGNNWAEPRSTAAPISFETSVSREVSSE